MIKKSIEICSFTLPDKSVLHIIAKSNSAGQYRCAFSLGNGQSPTLFSQHSSLDVHHPLQAENSEADSNNNNAETYELELVNANDDDKSFLFECLSPAAKSIEWFSINKTETGEFQKGFANLFRN